VNGIDKFSLKKAGPEKQLTPLGGGAKPVKSCSISELLCSLIWSFSILLIKMLPRTPLAYNKLIFAISMPCLHVSRCMVVSFEHNYTFLATTALSRETGTALSSLFMKTSTVAKLRLPIYFKILIPGISCTCLKHDYNVMFGYCGLLL